MSCGGWYYVRFKKNGVFRMGMIKRGVRSARFGMGSTNEYGVIGGIKDVLIMHR
jgi:hypothetical protein